MADKVVRFEIENHANACQCAENKNNSQFQEKFAIDAQLQKISKNYDFEQHFS